MTIETRVHLRFSWSLRGVLFLYLVSSLIESYSGLPSAYSSNFVSVTLID